MRTFQGVWRAGALGSLLLVASVVVALAWANLGGYEAFWTTDLTIATGPLELRHDLRFWVNSGLMTLFFLAVGLEARRESDLGDSRERRRLVLPLAAGILGMVVPVALYLTLNRGGGAARAWGVAMSTDTALALGTLTLLARNAPKRTRTFLLTVFVVDDIVGLIVIGALYSSAIQPAPVAIALAAFAAIVVVRRVSRHAGRQLAVLLGFVMWFSLMTSGLDPVVAGLAIGLATSAWVPVRRDLEHATGLVRRFRESPSAALAQSAATGLTDSRSENERILYRLSPWTSYAVVPLFAVANAGVLLTPQVLRAALTTPVTWGISSPRSRSDGPGTDAAQPRHLIRVASPSVDGRASTSVPRCRGGGGRGGPKRVLGDARSAVGASGQTEPRRPPVVRVRTGSRH